MPTNEELQMTMEEMVGGASGRAAYEARVAELRGETPAPFVYNPQTAGGKTQYERQYGETEAQYRARTANLGGISTLPLSEENQVQADISRLYGYAPGMEMPTEAGSYANQLSIHQQQIDALDVALAQQRARIAAQYQKIGQGRLGSQRAMQAQSGMLGQVSGEAQQSELQMANLAEQEAAIAAGTAGLESEKRQLFGDIRRIAAEDLIAKREAATLGAEKYLEFTGKRKEDIKSRLQQAIRARLVAGLELGDKEIKDFANQLGISVQDVIDTYTTAKQEYGVESEKLDREAKLYGLDVTTKEMTIKEKQAAIDERKAKTAQIYSKMAGTAIGERSAYAIETNQRVFDASENLLNRVTNNVAGLSGRIYANIPGTEAYDFNADLQTLKANVAFGSLVAMREASKTGGALGQVSDREGRLLESVLGALDIGQSPENLKRNLKQINDSISRWLEAANKYLVESVEEFSEDEYEYVEE